MCSFELDGTNRVEHIVQFFFLLVACVVKSLGFLLSIVLIGLLPLYVFLFCFWRMKLSLKSPWVVASLALSGLLTVFMSSVIWLVESILGAWG